MECEIELDSLDLKYKCFNKSLINSFIHIEHLCSTASRKLARGAPLIVMFEIETAFV